MLEKKFKEQDETTKMKNHLESVFKMPSFDKNLSEDEKIHE